MTESLLKLSLNWVYETSGFLQRSDLPVAAQQQADLNPASVLIPLFHRDGEWHVLFIRRVANERDRHSGQVAFPGGRQDPADADPVAAALREAEEEIALKTMDVTIAHVLPQYLTSSSYIVTPVIGVVPWPYDYKPQPTEVDRIFSIPLCWLADQGNVELRDRRIPRQELSPVTKVVYYKEYDSELLWGASARMMISVLQSLQSGELCLSKLQEFAQ